MKVISSAISERKCKWMLIKMLHYNLLLFWTWSSVITDDLLPETPSWTTKHLLNVIWLYQDYMTLHFVSYLLTSVLLRNDWTFLNLSTDNQMNSLFQSGNNLYEYSFSSKPSIPSKVVWHWLKRQIAGSHLSEVCTLWFMKKVWPCVSIELAMHECSLYKVKNILLCLNRLSWKH